MIGAYTEIFGLISRKIEFTRQILGSMEKNSEFMAKIGKLAINYACRRIVKQKMQKHNALDD